MAVEQGGRVCVDLRPCHAPCASWGRPSSIRDWRRVRTELLEDLPEDNSDFKIITTDVLVKATIKGLGAGQLEIRPGQANQLYWMSRIAPSFINAQLEKGSKSLVPPPEA